MRGISLTIILLILLILQSPEEAFSQIAIQYYNSGMELFNQPYFDEKGASEAVKLFNEVIKQDSTFLEAYFRIGALY